MWREVVKLRERVRGARHDGAPASHTGSAEIIGEITPQKSKRAGMSAVVLPMRAVRAPGTLPRAILRANSRKNINHNPAQASQLNPIQTSKPVVALLKV